METRVIADGNFSDCESFHFQKRGDEAMQSAIKLQFFHAFTAEGPVRATSVGDLFVGELVPNPVGDSAGSDADEIIALAARSDARPANAVETQVQGFQKFGDIP